MAEDAPLRELYPEIEPYNSGMLDVGDGHQVYYEESGNATGKPVVFVHGGPGGGTNPKCRRFFDSAVYRIVLFDQRGAGKSLPTSCLENNTTWHLVADMEKLREHLSIEKWMLFGGSWGSTLSLAYAETHPDRVTEMVLRGIFMLRPAELEWFYEDKGLGAKFIYPDAWEKYLEPIPEEERGNMIQAYYKRLTSEDPEVRKVAATAWSVWEGSTSKLVSSPDFVARYAGDEFADVFARIECHYFSNLAWFEESQLLRDVGKIRHIPAVIVQGRYDIVCPMKSSWDLHRAWPEAEYNLMQTSGHSAFEPAIQSKLVEATDRFGSA